MLMYFRRWAMVKGSLKDFSLPPTLRRWICRLGSSWLFVAYVLELPGCYNLSARKSLKVLLSVSNIKAKSLVVRGRCCPTEPGSVKLLCHREFMVWFGSGIDRYVEPFVVVNVKIPGKGVRPGKVAYRTIEILAAV